MEETIEEITEVKKTASKSKSVFSKAKMALITRSQFDKINKLLFNDTKKTNKGIKSRKKSLPNPLLTCSTALIANVNLNYFTHKQNLSNKNSTISNMSSLSDLLMSMKKNNRLVRTKAKFFELFIALVFLTALVLLEIDNYNDSDFKFQEMIIKLFQPKSQNDLSNTISLIKFWDYIETTLLDAVYLGTVYEVENSTKSKPYYVYPGNLILESPILTQRRVHNHSCEIKTSFRKLFKNGCYGELSHDNEEKEPFPFHKEFSADEREGCFYLNWNKKHGILNFLNSDTSDLSGFTIQLNKSRDDIKRKLAQYKYNDWIDRQTRLVSFHMIVLNVNENIFCQVSLFFNFHSYGYVETKFDSSTLHLQDEGHKYSILMTLFFLVLVYYIFEVVILIIYYGKTGAYNLSFIIPALLYFIADIIYHSTIMHKFNHHDSDNDTTSKINKLDIQDFSFAINFKTAIIDTLWAISFLTAFYAIYTRYSGFNVITTYFCVFSAKSFGDRISYAALSFVLYMSLGLPFHFIYGRSLGKYKSAILSISTLFRFILGDVYFEELQSVNFNLTAFNFIIFMILIYFILINVNLALLNFHYNLVSNNYAQEVDIDIGLLFASICGKNKTSKSETAIIDTNSRAEVLPLQSEKSKENASRSAKKSKSKISLLSSTNGDKTTASLDGSQNSTQIEPTEEESMMNTKPVESECCLLKRLCKNSSFTFSSLQTNTNPSSMVSSNLTSVNSNELTQTASQLSTDTILKSKSESDLTKVEETLSNSETNKTTSSVRIDKNKLITKLTKLVKADFQKYKENETISSKAKKNSELNIFCTRNEFVYYFNKRLCASNRKTKELLDKFGLKDKKIFHITFANELIEDYIKNFLSKDQLKELLKEFSKKTEAINLRSASNLNSINKSLNQVTSFTREDFDKNYVTVQEYEVLKSELEGVNKSFKELYQEFNSLIENFNISSLKPKLL